MRLGLLGTSGAYPIGGDASSGYLVKSGSSSILIDCGSGVLSNLMRYSNIASLQAVFISHMHPDHFIDLIALNYAVRYGEGSGEMDVYLPKGGRKKFISLLDVISDGKVVNLSLNLREYVPEKMISLEPFDVLPFEVEHAVPSFGMLISSGEKNIVYTSDTSPCESLAYWSRKSDLLLSENTLGGGAPEQNPVTHMSSYDAGRLAEEAEVSTLVLTHYWPSADRIACSREASEYFGGRILQGVTGKFIDLNHPESYVTLHS